MKEFEISIDNTIVKAKPNQTILEVAHIAGINIPSLCFLKGINEPSSCRICVVEVEGVKNLVTSCTAKVSPNMHIFTSSPRVLESRKKTVELLLSNHNQDCLSCDKNLNCVLQSLSKQFGCNDKKYMGEKSKTTTDLSSPCIVRDESKCVLCNRCVAVCAKKQGVSAINKIGRGFNTQIGCAFNEGLKNSTCVGCGQCVLVCPTGAITEKNDINKVLRFLNDTNVEVACQVAPSVRVAIAEEFGYPIGSFQEKKLAGVLKKCGFDYVYDVNMAADFTIVEESKELINRITKHTAPLPMFTSCCPAWYKYIEDNEPKFVKNLSTCKSPNGMLGSLVRYYNKIRNNNKELKIVSIMPCTSKKAEILRENTIDANITTRELATLIKHLGISFKDTPDGKFDEPFGQYSGAGLIFGVSGGVMEAALRTASKLVDKNSNQIDFEVVRESEGKKIVEIKLGKTNLCVGIVNGLANAIELLDEIKNGLKLDFVEVMACPGGCINGGGQPLINYNKIPLKKVISLRANSIYKEDSKLKIRKSDANTGVQQIYSKLLKNNNELIHKLLHNK